MGSNTDDIALVYPQGQDNFLFSKQPHKLAPIHSAHIRLDKVAGS
jgi:hypothetical protein